jgi:hypothetical protein
MPLDLTIVNDQIAALVADMLTSVSAVDYKEGDKSVSASQRLDNLLKVRKALLENPASDVGGNDVVEIAKMNFDTDIDQFGKDNSENEQ